MWARAAKNVCIFVDVSSNASVMHMRIRPQYVSILARFPRDGILGKCSLYWLCADGQIRRSEGVLGFASTSGGADGHPYDFAILVSWIKSVDVVKGELEPHPFFLVVHVHELGVNQERVAASDVVRRLYRSIVQSKIDVCAFVARFEEMLDWSTADWVLRTDVK